MASVTDSPFPRIDLRDGGRDGTREAGSIPARVGPFPPLSPAERARSLRETLAAAPRPDDLWVFAYASLLWRPCFEASARRNAFLPEHRRAFCIWTVEARGRPERPGLGLGLERGGAGCHGVALQVPRRRTCESLCRLWEREMLTGVYAPRWLGARTACGPQAVLAFVAAPGHPQYAGGLDDEERAACIARARGTLGSCLEYLERTVDALEAAGITDPDLAGMRDRVRTMRAVRARDF